ncbi:patatin-like phospholipase family protein [Mesorhizobium sp. M0598]|uniref:patatin-like phospholipase family protein n=1 Tax=Mesorhizobium sp. M0598 TaxID=2956968 RepID=UPI00333783F0
MGEQEGQQDQNPVSAPLLPCDIVMAGGVTSGVIYPGAVAMIARRYSFRSIGGTSVGAIAAAVTAAAEYGRRTGSNSRAFDEIAAMPKSLGDVAPDGHSRLFHLFTPEASTKPLLALVTPLMSARNFRGKITGILTASLSAWPLTVGVTVATLAGLALVIEALVRGQVILTLISVVAGLCLLLVVWLAMLTIVLTRSWLPLWRANGYGICTGRSAPSFASGPAIAAFEGLTPWMHRIVQSAAGRSVDEAPLTFGDLWNAPPATGAKAGGIDPTAPRSIELAMIASDISRNRTVQLPFLESPSPIYLDIATLRRYFPTKIVEWMEAKAGAYEERNEQREGWIRLPLPQDLPLVFAARLSLSFPILLSAVPLLTPDFEKGKAADGKIPLRAIWFSDGGLTSNFPIHFFDSPIPSRPTFCLNLIDYGVGAPTVAADGSQEDQSHEHPAGKAIAQPRDERRSAKSRPEWSDNQMLMAPGIRDRIVNIALREDEGGLNLDMDAKVLSDLDLRGRAAGLLIAARFDPEAKRDPESGEENVQFFANHRWVRFRNVMAAFEDISRRFATSRRRSDKAAADRGESLLDQMIQGSAEEKLGYPAPAAARDFYRNYTDELEKLSQAMAEETRANPDHTFDRPRTYHEGGSKTPAGAAPRPKMRIRLRPMADNDPRAECADLPERFPPDPNDNAAS